MKRSAKSHIGHVTAKLGQHALMNGPEGVDRAAAACFPVIFADQPDAETTRRVIEISQAIRARAEKRGKPVHKVGDKNARVKIRWSDEFIARFRREAYKFENSLPGNRRLAVRLGLPEYCADALRLGR